MILSLIDTVSMNLQLVYLLGHFICSLMKPFPARVTASAGRLHAQASELRAFRFSCISIVDDLLITRSAKLFRTILFEDELFCFIENSWSSIHRSKKWKNSSILKTVILISLFFRMQP